MSRAPRRFKTFAFFGEVVCGMPTATDRENMRRRAGGAASPRSSDACHRTRNKRMSPIDSRRPRPTCGPCQSINQDAIRNKVSASRPVSRILCARRTFVRRGDRHFSRLLAQLFAEAKCGIPAAVGRAAQPPILPCTGLGFSCRRDCSRRGGLLPHLFTMTDPAPCDARPATCSL